MRKFILFLILCLSSFNFLAQNCGSTELHEHMLQTDPSYENGLQELEDNIQYFQELYTLSGNAAADNEELLTIPIVFHIIHVGEPIGTGSNISDGDVLDAFNRLNENFRAVNGLGADINMEFCLATNDPEGNPTNGINRVDGSGVPEYTTYGIQHSGDFGASSTAIKDLSRWPTHLYYNVWIVEDIYPTWIGGFANYPNGNDYDGSVVVYNTVNAFSTVLTHELGHGFNLRHTFQGDSNGCPLNDECLEQGDRVCDTPPHQQNDCSTSSCFSGDLTNSIDNYMSYCGGKVLFTQGQKERVRAAALSDPRQNLLLSNGCSPVVAHNVSILEIDETIIKTCLGEFYPRIRVLNQGSDILSSFEVVYQLEGLETHTQTISTNLAYGEEAWIDLDPITYTAGEFLFSVTVQTPNGQLDGYSDFDTKSITIELDPNIIITPNYIEDFESYADYSFFPPGWSKESFKDGAVIYSTWNGISNSVNSSMSSGTLFSSNNLPVENILIMPTIDLVDYTNPKLLFKYIFAKYNDNDVSNAGLAISVSTTCDGSGNILWEKVGEELVTVEQAVGNDFNYGKLVEIDLSAYEDQQIIIKFVHTYTNPQASRIQLDNINVLGNFNGIADPCPIPLNTSMVFNEDGTPASGFDSAIRLVDEQTFMGNPPAGAGGEMTYGWSNSSDGVAYLDLGEDYDIEDLYLYDGYGSGQFQIAPGLPSENLPPVIDIDLDAWPIQWRSFTGLNFTNRYITFRKIDENARVHEIYICGSPSNGSTPPTCSDGILNQDETGIDCGGVCPPCPSGGGCPESISGFTALGEFGTSKYYISNETEKPVVAHNNAVTLGGYLVSINSVEENDFIQQNISDMAYIGLNDQSTEGSFEWLNGDAFTFDNIDPCSFCNENADDQDFLIIAPWDGKWSFSNFYNQRKYIIEVPCEGGGTDQPDLTISNLENVATNMTPGSVEYFEFNLNNIGTITATNSYIIGMYISTDATLSSDDILAGEIPTANTFVGTDPDVPAAITVPSVSDGNYYLIVKADIENTVNESNENNNTITSGVISINSGGGGCTQSPDISGFSYIGEYQNSRYYFSNESARPTEAQTKSENNGGYLTTISSAGENDFIQQGISGLVYIGLNDENEEGTLEWFSGEPVTYENLDICSFCNENSESQNYAVIAGWNGTWSWSNFWNKRRYVMEIPCSSNSLLIQLPNSEKREKLEFLQIVPNPATQFIGVQIKSSTEKEVDIQIFDSRGTMIHTSQHELLEGLNGIELNIANLKGGMYWIQIPQANRKQSIKKFVKIRE